MSVGSESHLPYELERLVRQWAAGDTDRVAAVLAQVPDATEVVVELLVVEIQRLRREAESARRALR